MILIDAEEIIWEINEIHKNHGLKDNEQMIFDETDVIALILAAPTIDAVPVVHGRWIEHHVARYECNCCNMHFITCRAKDWNYCPYCGAKMDEEVE